MKHRSLVLALVCALGVAATASLGLWQLRRADLKQQLQAQQQAAAQRAPIGNAELLDAPARDWAQQPTRLRGRWLPEQQFWLDNRPLEHRVGTILLTPLQLEGSPQVVWVQRGWQGRAAGRHGVPDFPPAPSGVVVVQGRLAPQASRAYALGAEGEGPLRQNLDLPASARSLGRPVLPWVLWQTGPGCAPLDCQWPAPDLGLAKHWGYAAQWFAMAALILGLYVWFQFFRPRRPADHG